MKELAAALNKTGMEQAAGTIKPIVPSPKVLGYRRTARFKTGESEKEPGVITPGFYRNESRDLIEIDRCLLLDDRINAKLASVKMNIDGLVGFDLFLDSDGEVRPFYRFSERDPGADFVQVNSDVNSVLVDYLDRTIRERTEKGMRILDLYCGDGNLSLQLPIQQPQ